MASAGNASFIDTYRRGCFICEAKSFNLGKNTETVERKLIKAKSQAESYARNLPGLLAALEAVARAHKHADGKYSGI